MLETLTIGQMAAVFRINIQTLYHYDRKGLLVPSFRDPATGRRKYSFKQVQQLSTILYLKRCGFSLEEIKEIESDLTPQKARDRFFKKSEDIMRQWREIIRWDEALHKKLGYIDHELGLRLKEEGRILYRKKRYYLEIGMEETAYGTEDLYYHPLVVSYYPTGKVFGALLEKKDSAGAADGPIVTIPNGTYLIAYHTGSYTTIPAHQEEIMGAHPELKFTGDVYTFDIVDQMNCSTMEDFITKMEFEISD